MFLFFIYGKYFNYKIYLNIMVSSIIFLICVSPFWRVLSFLFADYFTFYQCRLLLINRMIDLNIDQLTSFDQQDELIQDVHQT